MALDTPDVSAGVREYLNVSRDTNATAEWRNPGNLFENPWFKPLRFGLYGEDGKAISGSLGHRDTLRIDSSIVKGINMVKSGEADLFVSAGNSGALMAGGLFILGRIPGIDRPAMASIYPILGKEAALLIDASLDRKSVV